MASITPLKLFGNAEEGALTSCGGGDYLARHNVIGHRVANNDEGRD